MSDGMTDGRMSDGTPSACLTRRAQDGEGRELRRCLINADQVKYVAMPPAMPVFKMDARGTMVPVQGTEVVVPKNVVITL